MNMKLKTSLLAAIFTSYRSRERRSVYQSRFGEKFLVPIFDTVSRLISSSVTSEFLSRLARFLLSLRLKLYGAMLFAFGVYSTATAVTEQFILSDGRELSGIIFGVVCAVSALPLVVSDDTLSGTLSSSRIGAALCRITGIRREAVEVVGARGRASYGFLIGAALGTLTFFVSPYRILLVAASMIALWLIMASPEFGVIATAFMIPFWSTLRLTALVGATALSFLIKVVRGKRFVSFELTDGAALGLTIVLLFSAFTSGDAWRTPLKMALYMTAYFLAASLIRSTDWWGRAVGAVVAGAAVAGAMTVVAALGGIFVPGIGFAIGGLFESSLTEARLAGGDPSSFNMLLTAAIPLALSKMLIPRGGVRIYDAIALALTVYPMIETRSAWALISAGVGVMILLAIRKPRLIFLPLGGVAAAAIVRLAFPSFALSVWSSVTSHFDKFISIRSHTVAAISSLPARSYIAGIGFGDETFAVATTGGGAGGGFYNTFFKFWIESGLAGALILTLFIWLLITASFGIIDRIDLARHSQAIKSAAPRHAGRADVSPFAAEFAVSRRMSVAGPLSSALALVVYGIADNVWADGRIFLLFWIVCGITAGAVRCTRGEIKDHENSWVESVDKERGLDVDIRVG